MIVIFFCLERRIISLSLRNQHIFPQIIHQVMYWLAILDRVKDIFNTLYTRIWKTSIQWIIWYIDLYQHLLDHRLFRVWIMQQKQNEYFSFRTRFHLPTLISNVENSLDLQKIIKWHRYHFFFCHRSGEIIWGREGRKEKSCMNNLMKCERSIKALDKYPKGILYDTMRIVFAGNLSISLNWLDFFSICLVLLLSIALVASYPSQQDAEEDEDFELELRSILSHLENEQTERSVESGKRTKICSRMKWFI